MKVLLSASTQGLDRLDIKAAFFSAEPSSNNSGERNPPSFPAFRGYHALKSRAQSPSVTVLIRFNPDRGVLPISKTARNRPTLPYPRISI